MKKYEIALMLYRGVAFRDSMSIPDDIREIRRKRYEESVTRAADPTPCVAKVDPIIEESFEEILARVAIYERDEKLAMDLYASQVLDNARDSSPVRMPIPDVVEQLIDSYNAPTMSRSPINFPRLLPERARAASYHT